MYLMRKGYRFAVAATRKDNRVSVMGKTMTVTTRLSARCRRAVLSMTFLTLRHNAPVVLNLNTQVFSVCSAGMAVSAYPDPCVMVMTHHAVSIIVLFCVFLMGECRGAVTRTTGKNNGFGIFRRTVTVAAMVSIRSGITSFLKMTVLTLCHDTPMVCILVAQSFSICSCRVTLTTSPVCFRSHGLVIMTMDTLTIVVFVRMYGMSESHVSPAGTTRKHDYCRSCRDHSLLSWVTVPITGATNRTPNDSNTEDS
jgi:hypothetical protein